MNKSAMYHCINLAQSGSDPIPFMASSFSSLSERYLLDSDRLLLQKFLQLLPNGDLIYPWVVGIQNPSTEAIELAAEMPNAHALNVVGEDILESLKLASGCLPQDLNMTVSLIVSGESDDVDEEKYFLAEKSESNVEFSNSVSNALMELISREPNGTTILQYFAMAFPQFRTALHLTCMCLGLPVQSLFCLSLAQLRVKYAIYDDGVAVIYYGLRPSVWKWFSSPREIESGYW